MSSVAEVTRLPIGSIKVVSNVRKHFDEKALEELTQNVKKHGVLQPVLVRKNGAPNVYELIAGERRLRASKAAGSEDIPVRVLDCTADEALEIQAFENLHRKDLGPIEEARAFKMLLDSKKHDVVALASRVSKSEAHVYRALGLLELPTIIQDLIEKDELSPAHGHQLLRIPAVARPPIIKQLLQLERHAVSDNVEGHNGAEIVKRYMTAKELQVLIDNRVGQNLARAQFPRDVPYAGENACSVCPKNSGNQGMLFDGAKDGRCLDKPCFSKKTDQVYLDLQEEGKRRWPALEFIGRGRQNHYKKRTIEDLPGNAMLSEAEHNHPVIKKLLAEKPGKLGYAVVLPLISGYSYGGSTKWDRARLILAVRDPGLIGGMMADKIIDGTKPKPAGKSGGRQSESGSLPVAKKVSERDTFIEEAVGAALIKACVNIRGVLEKPVLRAIAKQAESYFDAPEVSLEDMFTRHGLKYPLEDKGAEREDFVRVAFVCAVMDWDGVNEGVAKDAGIDVAKVKADAKKAAGAEFDAKAKAAPATKGKKKA